MAILVSTHSIAGDQTRKAVNKTEGKANREVLLYSCLFRASSIRDVVYWQNTRGKLLAGGSIVGSKLTQRPAVIYGAK